MPVAEVRRGRAGRRRAPARRRVVRARRFAGRPPRRHRRAVRGVAGAGPQHAVGAARRHRCGLAAGRAGGASRARPSCCCSTPSPATPPATATPRSTPSSPAAHGRRSAPRGDDLAEQTALGFRLVLAHTRGDAAAALGLVEEAAHLPGLDRGSDAAGAAARWSRRSVPTSSATSSAAPTCSTAVSIEGLPPVIAEVDLRFRWHSADVRRPSRRRRPPPGPRPRRSCDPERAAVPAGRPLARRRPVRLRRPRADRSVDFETRSPGRWQNGRDWFNYGVFTAMVWSSFGDRDVVGTGRASSLRSLDLDTGTSRNGGPIAVAAAAAAVLDHDDERAARDDRRVRRAVPADRSVHGHLPCAASSPSPTSARPRRAPAGTSGRSGPAHGAAARRRPRRCSPPATAR